MNLLFSSATRIGLSAVLLFASAALLSQENNRREQQTRRPARRGPIVSPEIHDDHKVTFRLRAPEASEVSVNGQWPDGNAAMTLGEGGVWSVTTGPIEAGVWEYSLQADGIRMIDPGNPWIKPMRQPRTSILHLPGSPPLIHDFQDVPQGAVRHHAYQSKSLGRLRHLVVYTPPGYDGQTDAQYPTLYLQHGSGDNHATWTVHGKAHWILDNLIAQNKAVSMVIVMMDGHASTDRGDNTELFERDLIEDVMPYVESHYRVKPEASHRGIAGLSMGGGQSLTIGLNHTDLFSWVGGFSSSVPREESVASALESSDRTNRQLKLLWIACGEDDFLLDRNKDFIALLIDKKIRHEWLLTSGNHSWPIWRDYLADFLPRLFQPGSNAGNGPTNSR